MSSNQQRAYVLRWPELLRWDLKSARAAAFRAAHPTFQPLGEFIEESTEIVHPSREPSHSWPVFGVSNKDGVSFSHFQLGESFNSAYKRIRKDWFFHNPTHANVGSLGRVPDVPADAITSSEYQVWRIRRGLLPDFVEILIRLPFFLDLVDYHRVGAVKERLFVENLCEIAIPVLTEHQQRVIIDRWHAAQTDIAAARERVEKRKGTIDARFFADLGLKSPDAVAMRKAFAVRWEDLLRWGVGFNFLKQSGADLSRGKYPVVELGSLLDLIQYGTSEKANTSGDGVAVIRMNNIVGGQLDLTTLKHLRLPRREVERLTLKEGDILFNRTNSKELVGKCGVFHAKGEFVFASYLIRVRADVAKADADFLAYVINSPIGRQQINALSRQIIGQANVNSEELRGLQIPLPPLAVQRQIMERVAVGRAEIARERDKVEKVAKNVNADVQSLILGPKPLNEK
jgi:type I restriction enzyme, S subunit